MSDTYQEYAARAYEQAVKSSAQALRDLADEFEQRALDTATFADNKRVRAASRAYHTITWGLANASIERIISTAAEADTAER